VTDTPRLAFAIFLGASMTAALLAAMGPWIGPPRAPSKGERLGAALWSLWMMLWPLWAAMSTAQRTFQPWQGAVAGSVALALAVAVPPVASAVGALPVGGVVGLSVLRLAGVVRGLAMRTGWLPERYAVVAVAGDVGVALSAVALLAFGLRRPNVVRGWALVALASLGVALWLQARDVRPTPSFESLAMAHLTPLLAVSYVLVLWATRKKTMTAPGGWWHNLSS